MTSSSFGGPNCVNLRKRLTVPLGYGKWSSFDECGRVLAERDLMRNRARTCYDPLPDGEL